MKRVLVISLAVVLTLSLSIVPVPANKVMAADWYVSSGESIQDAIDSASSGDIIYVAAGTYNENIELQGGVIIQGSGADVTTINGTGSGSVVYGNRLGSAAKLDGFTITDGYHSSQGGGIYLQVGSSPTISNCIITGNSAGSLGGGISIYDQCSPTISNCVITGNSASYGGGIFAWSSDPTIINCTITGNSATDGGGMYNWSSSSNITNSILYGNTATGSGRNIFDLTSTPSVTYSCVGDGYSGTGNIDADPSFENPEAGDYHLQAGSPCIDKGTDAGAPSTDLDGITRPQGTQVDMGAYEYQLTNSPPIADAGPDQTVEQTSYEGAEVTLNGTASSDPDDDPLTFSWSAQDISFDDATSSTPTATFPLGTTTVTLMVNDGTVDSDPDTMMVTVLSLHSIKTQAILELESLLPTGEKKVDKKIEKAIEHLEKALDEALWLDDTHLDEKHGAKVFNEEKKTVKELKHLLDKDDTPEDVKDVCQSVINKLIEVDKLLATTAYEEAQSGAGYPKVDKELEKCDKELEKAEEELAKGKYDKAIKHYKNAWKHAQKALRKAPEDDE